MEDPDYEPEATVEVAYLSSMMCFLTDESAASREMLAVEESFQRLGGWRD